MNDCKYNNRWNWRNWGNLLKWRKLIPFPKYIVVNEFTLEWEVDGEDGVQSYRTNGHNFKGIFDTLKEAIDVMVRTAQTDEHFRVGTVKKYYGSYSKGMVAWYDTKNGLGLRP